jgi:hypothetical protein
METDPTLLFVLPTSDEANKSLQELAPALNALIEENDAMVEASKLTQTDARTLEFII